MHRCCMTWPSGWPESIYTHVFQNRVLWLSRRRVSSRLCHRELVDSALPLVGGGHHHFLSTTPSPKHPACPLTSYCMAHCSLLTLEHTPHPFHWAAQAAGGHPDRSNPDVLIHTGRVAGSQTLLWVYAHAKRGANGGRPTSHAFCM